MRWRCGGGVGGAGVQEPIAGHTGPYSGHSSTPPPPPPPPLLPPPPPPPPPHHLHSHPRTTLHSPPPLFTGKLMILAEIPQTRPDLTIDLKQILQLPWTRPHTTEPPGPLWPGGQGGAPGAPPHPGAGVARRGWASPLPPTGRRGDPRRKGVQESSARQFGRRWKLCRIRGPGPSRRAGTAPRQGWIGPGARGARGLGG